MPFCEINKYLPIGGLNLHKNTAIKIFYRTYGNGPIKVLLIIGLAGTHESWGPQIKGLTGTQMPNDDGGDVEFQNINVEGFQLCAFDNRGMGRSSVPTKKSEYTTTIMAKDTLALMDHLGWRKAHVFGHSMGAMIACKLAAMAPDRILSLALLNVTGGGFECFPKIDRKMISIAIRFLKAKTPEERAAVDLDTHYTKEYLDENVGPHTRRTILYQEYVKGISSSGMQSNYGFEGQINACWTHKVTYKELEVIRSAGFLISVIHGRYDIIAQMYYARKLAEKLQPYAKMVDLHGGHLVSHERPEEARRSFVKRERYDHQQTVSFLDSNTSQEVQRCQVNEALVELIKASELKLSPQDWSNLPWKGAGSQVIGIQILSSRAVEWNCLSFLDVLRKLQLMLLYILGLFVMAFEQGWKIVRRPKASRVETSVS